MFYKDLLTWFQDISIQCNRLAHCAVTSPFPAPVRGNHQPVRCLYELNYSRYFVQWNHMCCFMSGFPHLVDWFQDSSTLLHISKHLSSLSLNNNPLYVYTLICSSTHQLRDIWGLLNYLLAIVNSVHGHLWKKELFEWLFSIWELYT